MRKLITIILLLITIQYTFGLYTVYVFNGCAIKQHMRHAIAAGVFQPQQVVSITVSLQGITESEANYWQQDEISYKGKMYDVITKQQQAGNLVVQCLCDEDENNLVGFFLNTMHHTRRFPGKGISSFQHLFSPFVLDDNGYSFNSTGHPKTRYIQIPVSYMSKGFTYVPAPPPWQV